MEEEKVGRLRAEKAEASLRLELVMTKERCKRLEQQLAFTRQNGAAAGAGGGAGGGGGIHGGGNISGGGGGGIAPVGLASLAAASGTAEDGAVPEVNLQCTLAKSITIQQGNARVLDYDPVQSWLVHSGETVHATPFARAGSTGIVKVSSLDYADRQYVTVHSKTIRDLSCCPDGSGVVLTVALDKKAKLTNMNTNNIVQTYSVDAMPWACCWLSPFSFVCGLSNSSLIEFDTRNTREPVRIDKSPPGTKPIHSLHKLDSADGAPVSGLLTGTLGGCGVWKTEQQDGDGGGGGGGGGGGAIADDTGSSSGSLAAASQYGGASSGSGSGAAGIVRTYQPLVGLAGSCTWVARHEATQTCLASFRPSQGFPRVRHIVGKIQPDAAVDPPGQIGCFVAQQLNGAPSQRLLSRSCLATHPDAPGRLFVCAGDEPSGMVKLWDASTGNVANEIACRGKPCLDVKAFGTAGGQQMVCTLTESHLLLHAWGS